MELSSYKYLTELQGIALVDISMGGLKIDKLSTTFRIDLNQRQFDFSIEHFDKINELGDCFFIKDDIGKADYIYGTDENNIPFTVFNCSICPLQAPVKTMRIVWNDIIIGKHIPKKEDYLVCKMQCVVEDSKNHYRASVGKHEYKIESGTISVKTGWSRLPDEENNRIIFNGTLFELISDTPISFVKMKDCFFRILEMYSLWIGYFPEIKDMRFCNHSDEIIYANHHSIHFSTHNNVSLDRRLFPHDKHNKNYSCQYENWAKIREKNIPVFVMFGNALNGQDIIHQARTATLIQCIEGYFNTHHKDKLIKPYLDNNVKNAITNTVTDSLSKSNEIRALCGENYNKVIESVKNLLGRIHRMSLKETILFAINYTPHTQKIFAYETNNKVTEDKTLLDEFVQKAVKHRDFMSHLFSADSYFKGRENDLAKKKIELLLRLCFLHDIGLEITEKSLADYIAMIDSEFYGKNDKAVTI